MFTVASVDAGCCLLLTYLCRFSFHYLHLQLRKVAHEGCINRIRAMTQNPHISASWADTGHVQVRFLSWSSL